MELPNDHFHVLKTRAFHPVTVLLCSRLVMTALLVILMTNSIMDDLDHLDMAVDYGQEVSGIVLLLALEIIVVMNSGLLMNLLWSF